MGTVLDGIRLEDHLWRLVSSSINLNAFGEGQGTDYDPIALHL